MVAGERSLIIRLDLVAWRHATSGVIPKSLHRSFQKQRLLPSIGGVVSIAINDRLGPRTQLADERQAVIRARPSRPAPKSVIPPPEKYLEPLTVNGKADFDLDLLATGDPAMKSPRTINDLPHIDLIFRRDRHRELSPDHDVRKISQQLKVWKAVEEI